MNPVLGMTKINLRQSKTAKLIAGIVFGLGIVNYITYFFFPQGENSTVAAGNYLYLLPLMMAIFIPAQNFSKLMNLGGKRMDFFKSAILAYAPTAALVTLISLLMYYTVDPLVAPRIMGVLDLLDVFGFMARGPVVAFFQMTAFLTLFCCVLHSLTLAQGRWYGWAADVLIIAIISVFTPIAVLRGALIWFFNMIIFHDIAIVQILSCLLLSAAIYCAGLIPIKNKPI